MRRRGIAAGFLALGLGGAVFGVTTTIDSTYRADASAVARPVLGADDLLGVLRVPPGPVTLRFFDQLPYLPRAAIPIDRIAAKAGVPLEDVKLVDTALLPLFASFKEPPRRLKVVVEGADPELAARGANIFLTELIDRRRRWYTRELGRVRRYLRAKVRLRRAGERNFPSGPPNLRDELAAAEIMLRLERGTLRGIRRAKVPAEPISPRKARDALVASLIGALVGLVIPAAWLPGRWRRPRDRRR